MLLCLDLCANRAASVARAPQSRAATASASQAAGKSLREISYELQPPVQAPQARNREVAVDMLDIRVGTIVSVSVHPEADGLYMEQIDVGDDAPRQVLSGLVKWVPQGDMEGRRVAVVCNLKPAKMRGVMSHGMVLCASSEEAVEPLGVPQAAGNGARVMVEGYDDEPEDQINPKKKVLETLFPDMVTDAQGVPCFKGKPFCVSGATLTSSLANVTVR